MACSRTGHNAGVQSWRTATQTALYGPDGFYRRERPSAHFRTSAAHPDFAAAVLCLTRTQGLGAVLDLGSGSGELLAGLRRLDSTLELLGVDIASRPPGLDPAVDWSSEVPCGFDGLLVANEWLDSVPVDVVEQTAEGPRLVLVDAASGEEELGPACAREDLAWLARWWPLRAAGHRAEVGHPRDAAWSAVLARMSGGVAVAVDYAHLRAERAADGTLRAHRSGRIVPPVPDGSCDITSAVAMDAVRAAGEGIAATTLWCTDQATALAGLLPAATGLRDRLARAEVTDPSGLGGFTWLVQQVSCSP